MLYLIGADILETTSENTSENGHFLMLWGILFIVTNGRARSCWRSCLYFALLQAFGNFKTALMPSKKQNHSRNRSNRSKNQNPLIHTASASKFINRSF